MKILHLGPITLQESKKTSSEDSSNTFFKIGGLSNSITKLAEAQYLNNLKVGVITTRKSFRAVSKNIYWKSIYSNASLNLLLRDPFKKIEKEFGLPDILNTHDIFEIKQYPFIFHAFRRNIKIYITPRGTLSKLAIAKNHIKKGLFLSLFFNFVTKFIEGFVALNEGEKINIRQRYKKKKIIIISNGIENNSNKKKLYKKNYEAKLQSNIINIGYLGRFEIYLKGLDLLLNSYVEYQRRSKEIKIKLTLIGSHDRRKPNSLDFIQSTYKNLLDPSKLDVKGPFFNENKWKEISKFDIFTHPSRSEGMPNAVLEAMSMGIPCLLSPETNMKEIIESSRCGWIVNNTQKDIINGFEVIESLTKKELISIGQNGTDYANNNLTWEKVAKASYY